MTPGGVSADNTGGSATGGANDTGDAASGGTPGAAGSSATGGTSSATGGISSGGSTATGGTSSTDLWVATDGSDSNPGTEEQPFATLSYVHSRASAGVTIWIKPGTYSWSTTVTLSKSGTDSNPINVFAATGARPVIDFAGQPRDTSSARGIELLGDYWHIKGIDVANAGDNCIHINGSHNTIEWVNTYGCCDTGLQISVSSSQASDATRGAYNTVVNCDA